MGIDFDRIFVKIQLLNIEIQLTRQTGRVATR